MLTLGNAFKQLCTHERVEEKLVGRKRTENPCEQKTFRLCVMCEQVMNLTCYIEQ